MHFDIIAPSAVSEEKVIYNYGKEFLKGKNQEGLSLSSNECQFCHVEFATPAMLESIAEKGYYIIEIENCD